MSDEQLFDTTLFGGPPRGRTKRATSPPVVFDSVAVSGERWNGMSKTTPGLAHYVIGSKVIKRNAGQVSTIVSACGLVVVPHTFDPAEVRLGCPECKARKP